MTESNEVAIEPLSESARKKIERREKLAPIINKIMYVPRLLRNVMDRIPISNKLLSSGLTLVLTNIALGNGLELDQTLLESPHVTIAQGISFLVSGVVGYLTSDESTLVRNPPSSGNPDLPEDFDGSLEGEEDTDPPAID